MKGEGLYTPTLEARPQGYNYLGLDGWRPTSAQYDAMYDNCVRLGIFDDTMEAELVISEASALHGTTDWPQWIKYRCEGPDEAIGIKNLNVHRYPSSLFDSPSVN